MNKEKRCLSRTPIFIFALYIGVIAQGLASRGFAEPINTGIKPATPAVQLDTSLAVEEYIKLGMPSPEKAWTTVEFKSAVETLKKLQAAGTPLPIFNSSKSGKLFDRFITDENQRLALTDKMTFDQKLDVVMEFAQPGGQIVRVYALQLPIMDREIVELVGQNLRISGQLAMYIPTMIARKSPLNQVQRDGIVKMRTGICQQVNGVIMVLTDVKHCTEESRIRLCELMKEHLPNLLPEGDATTLSSAKASLTKLFDSEKTPAVKKAIDSVRIAIADIKMTENETAPGPATTRSTKAEWRTFTSKDGRFSASFPSVAISSQVDSPNSLDGGNVHVETLICHFNGTQFAILQLGPVKHRDRFVQKITPANSSIAKPVDVNGATWFEETQGEVPVSISRKVVIGEYLYIVAVESKDQITAVEKQAAATFMASLKIISATTKPSEKK